MRKCAMVWGLIRFPEKCRISDRCRPRIPDDPGDGILFPAGGERTGSLGGTMSSDQRSDRRQWLGLTGLLADGIYPVPEWNHRGEHGDRRAHPPKSRNAEPPRLCCGPASRCGLETRAMKVPL